MLNLLYVAVPILLGVLLALAITTRGRRPRSMEDGIQAFSKELSALAPHRRAVARSKRANRGA